LAVAGVGFSGRWLHLRHAVDGTLLQATTHTGASLRTPAAGATVIVGSHLAVVA
jgi:hypothetical protein